MTPADGGADDTETLAALASFVHATHRLEPDGLPALVRQTARRLGVVDARVYLADHEQHELFPLVTPGEHAGSPQRVDGTVAGRVFQTLAEIEVRDDEGGHLLIPLLDGTDRLGVLELVLDGATIDRERATLLASLVSAAIVSKSAYGDTIEVTRRRGPMAVRAEAQRELLPPLTLISPRFVVSALLAPSLEVAGDVFDFAANGDTLHLAILDAMGHSLSATLIATVATAAYRGARRTGEPLVECWRQADDAVAREFDGERFATAMIGELDLETGVLSSISAGHPPALIVRDNRVVARSAGEPTLPLGLRGEDPAPTSTQLQPRDRLLLFTDGIVEARAPDGEFFGEERLVEHLGRTLDSDLPAPEAVRRLIGTVMEHQGGTLGDDATLLLVEWRGPAQG